MRLLLLFYSEYSHAFDAGFKVYKRSVLGGQMEMIWEKKNVILDG